MEDIKIIWFACNSYLIWNKKQSYLVHEISSRAEQFDTGGEEQIMSCIV